MLYFYEEIKYIKKISVLKTARGPVAIEQASMINISNIKTMMLPQRDNFKSVSIQIN